MEYQVTLQNNRQSLMVQENETILEAANRARVSLNYGCIGGTCRLCKAKVIKGNTFCICTVTGRIPVECQYPWRQ